jgi:hypothetical protein
MKSRDILIFTFWMAAPIVIILSIFLAGCSPIVIKESEIIAEEIIEESLEHELKGQ